MDRNNYPIIVASEHWTEARTAIRVHLLDGTHLDGWLYADLDDPVVCVDAPIRTGRPTPGPLTKAPWISIRSLDDDTVWRHIPATAIAYVVENHPVTLV